jgi:hypothetical protein
MKTTCSSLQSRLWPLLLAALWNAAGPSIAVTAPVPVSQAWATRIEGPGGSFFQAAGISVGPSGDVFVAGQVRTFGYNHDLVISRRNPSGAAVWQKSYEPEEGWSADESPIDIVARGTNVYVAGTITSVGGSQDFLTLKYRDTGTLEWAARWDGAGHSGDGPVAMAVDGQGNVLVAGDSTGTNGTLDIVVLKYGPSGNLLWTYAYDGPAHRSDRTVGMRLDASANIYVGGTSGQWSDDSSVVTLKLSPDGEELWTARETSKDVYGLSARGLDVDSAGNVVIVANERSYGVTWKYDANGNRQWMARYRAEEPASMSAVHVRFDGSGNIITAANLYGSGTNDAVLIKYSTDGQQLWATRIVAPSGVAHLLAFDVDGEGNAYLTTTPVSDVVTVKVNPAGAQLWNITYNSQGLFYDYGEFLELTSTGEIFVAGRSTYSSESFVSLVKYTQQPVAGIVTAVVTPALQVVDPGTDVVFTAETTGAGPIQFQWRMNGRPIPDATNATLALTGVQPFHRGDYSVIISNPVGVTVSPEARLSVRIPPEVAVSPTQTLAYIGTDAAFLATVAGNDFVTLQWRHDGTNLPGATNEILYLVNLNPAAGGAYDLVATTFGGSTTSSAAGLRISSAIELVGITPHRSGLPTWEYAPQLRVLPTGDFLLAVRSNHVLGSSIVLHKHTAEGALLWSTVFESAEFTNAEPSRLALDAAGNIYVTGLSRQSSIAAEPAVLKYSPDGQLLWSRVLVGTNLWGIHSFAVDPSGNSTIAVLGVNGTTVTSYNSAGDVRWSFADPSPDNDTIAVAVDAFGHSYLGTTIRVGGDNEIRLRKFDSTGGTVWTRPYAEGSVNRLGALAVDSVGNLVVVGTGDLPGVPDSRMFVQKYSPGGQKLWETRTGSSWSELASIVAMAVGPDDEITVLTESDDDYEPGEQSGLTRVGSNGQFRYRIAEPRLLVSSPSQLALDDFGNAYITGYGGRPGTDMDAVTAKYDAYGNRPWLVYHGGPSWSRWESGLAVGVDAAGDIQVLATEAATSDSTADFSVLHYRQRDPAGRFRLQLIADAAGTFHLGVPAGDPFRIEASSDLRNWNALTESETQQLLQPGGAAFSASPQRFFRLVLAE